ncbi:hypothetical protein PYW08_010068 [Mythimna loreyi]|uniref:Uncharacterized protein n=1 Tax=Mythimna loreyi TaxID=667449 RepID=A0ACC2Q6J4_9NEOP|nr:hypothetical protein PYW08_010068 [Mythimna loreyi]
MFPSTLNSEIYVTQIHIQNEAKVTKTKIPDNTNIPSVNYNELLCHKDVKKCNSSDEIIRVIYGNTTVDNVRRYGQWFTYKNVYKMETENIKKEEGKEEGKAESKKSSKKSEKSKKSSQTVDSKKGQADKANKMEQIQESKEPEDDPAIREPWNPLDSLFLVKMLSLTFIMLSVTAAFVLHSYSSNLMHRIYVESYFGKALFIMGMGGILVLNYFLMCSQCMRAFPCNFVVLFMTVICMSVITSYITASYKTIIIFYALIATAVTVLVCLGLAMTSFDFTQYSIYLMVIGVAFAVLSPLIFMTSVILGFRYQTVQLVILFIGTLINSIVLIMELQMIIGGRFVSLNENDYAYGAFMLYTSIIDMFLKLLQIIGMVLDDGEDDW